MNAQEALDDLRQTLYVDETIGLNMYSHIESVLEPLQQLIDQSNAKPKTLEELGWEINDRFYGTAYSKRLLSRLDGMTLVFTGGKNPLYVLNYGEFTYEEILAIAEKMKELGMTNE